MNKQTLRQGLIILAGLAVVLSVIAMIMGEQITWYGIGTVVVALITALTLMSISSERDRV